MAPKRLNSSNIGARRKLGKATASLDCIKRDAFSQWCEFCSLRSWDSNGVLWISLNLSKDNLCDLLFKIYSKSIQSGVHIDSDCVVTILNPSSKLWHVVTNPNISAVLFNMSPNHAYRVKNVKLYREINASLAADSWSMLLELLRCWRCPPHLEQRPHSLHAPHSQFWQRKKENPREPKNNYRHQKHCNHRKSAVPLPWLRAEIWQQLHRNW